MLTQCSAMSHVSHTVPIQYSMKNTSIRVLTTMTKVFFLLQVSQILLLKMNEKIGDGVVFVVMLFVLRED